MQIDQWFRSELFSNMTCFFPFFTTRYLVESLFSKSWDYWYVTFLQKGFKIALLNSNLWVRDDITSKKDAAAISIWFTLLLCPESYFGKMKITRFRNKYDLNLTNHSKVMQFFRFASHWFGSITPCSEIISKLANEQL